MEKPRGLPEGIYALADPSSAITAFNLNNEFNLFGRKTYLIGTVSKSFAVIDDAPVEKEVVVEKQGSWVKNLVTGLVVTAALAACAVFVVATGGLGLGAVMLIGAAVGAGAVTTVVAVNDYKSGQARSYGEFLQLLDKGIKIGACAGAVVYGGWSLVTAVPEITVAGGSMAPMLTEKVMSFITRGGDVTFNGGVASIPLERSMDWISQIPDLVQSLAATAGTIFLWKTAVDLMDDVMAGDSSMTQGISNSIAIDGVFTEAKTIEIPTSLPADYVILAEALFETKAKKYYIAYLDYNTENVHIGPEISFAEGQFIIGKNSSIVGVFTHNSAEAYVLVASLGRVTTSERHGGGRPGYYDHYHLEIAPGVHGNTHVWYFNYNGVGRSNNKNKK